MARIDPLSKLTGALCLALWGLLLGEEPALVLLFLLVLSCGLMRSIGSFVLKRLSFLVLVLFLFQGLLYQGDSTTVMLGPLKLHLAGLQHALTLSLRLLIFVTSFLLVVWTTPPRVLSESLQAVGLPRRFAFILLAALQLESQLRESVQGIADAQRARGVDLDGGLRQRLASILPFIAPLVLKNLREVEQQTLALSERGFAGGKATLRHAMPPGLAGSAAIFLMALSTFALLGFKLFM